MHQAVFLYRGDLPGAALIPRGKEQADERHIADKDQKRRHLIQKRHGQPLPEQVQDADVYVLPEREEIICLRTNGVPQQKIDQQRTKAKHQKCTRDTRQVFGPWPVKPKCGQAEAANDDKHVREIKAEYARRPEQIAGKCRLRKNKRHERTERRDEKGKPEQGAPVRQDADWDQKHIDITKLQRQFIEPVEFIEPGYLKKLRIPGQKPLVNKKADDNDHAQCDQHSRAPTLRLAMQQRPKQHDRANHDRHQQKEAGIKRSYDHGVPPFCRKYRLSASTSPQPACTRRPDRPPSAA